MKRIAIATFFIKSALLAAIGVNPPEGFVALFNGEDLTGWYGDNPHQSRKADDRDAALKAQQSEFRNHWKVEKGELVNDG